MRTTIISVVLGLVFSSFTWASDYVSRQDLHDHIRVKRAISGVASNDCKMEKTLNELVKIIREKRIEVEALALSAGEIAHIRLRRGSSALAFRADTGQPLAVCLPAEFQDDVYRDARNEFENSRQLTLQLLAQGRSVDYTAGQLQQSIQRLRRQFEINWTKSQRLSSMDAWKRHKSTRQFLVQLEEEVRSVRESSRAMAQESHCFGGQTLRDLVAHLHDHYLEIAPCGCLEEGAATYRLLYELLQRHVQPIADEVIRPEIREHFARKARKREDALQARKQLVHAQAKLRANDRQQRVADRRRMDTYRQSYWRNLRANMAANRLYSGYSQQPYGVYRLRSGYAGYRTHGGTTRYTRYTVTY